MQARPKATRYPGAQPFSDDELSRRVFFGRKSEAVALTDKIVANRLVVVYAKSGLGKTSLLQAGISLQLRELGHVPLVVRVNDVKSGPIRSVLDGIQQAARSQGMEYKPGIEASLWHFFKTVQLWRGDLLMTPVLVLDQFEELFTLHAPVERSRFLKELGYLVRGSKPPVPEEPGAAISESPPEMRIVISLREDYLGALEEAADNVPQILDHRFRLTALSLDAARDAMQGPAQVEDARLETKPFTYHSEAVREILAHLSRRATKAATHSSPWVEPFHLQLVCQRVEILVAERQKRGQEGVEVRFGDLGGTDGLTRTLNEFYKKVLRSIRSRRIRRQVKRLCAEHLISPGGRRLSLDESEIERLVGLKPDTLRDLVDLRLLRSDQRADNWYYELSHDSLVEPILATQRLSGIAVGLLGLFASLFLAIGAAAGIVDLFGKREVFLTLVILAIFAAPVWIWTRWSLRRLKRALSGRSTQ